MKKLLVLSTMIALVSGLTAPAVTIQENTGFPAVDLIGSHYLEPTGNDANAIVRNELSGTNDIKVLAGQSFTLSSSATLSAITVQQGIGKNYSKATASDMMLWVGAYDTSDVSNHVAGATNVYEAIPMASQSFTGGKFYTFNLDTPTTLPAGDYAFELFWTTQSAQNVHRTWFNRSSIGGYADGQLVAEAFSATNMPPTGETTGEDVADLVFALHSAPVGVVAQLSANPDSLALNHDFADGSTTGTVDFSYTAPIGTAINITNITIGSESHPGSFSHLATLPLNLTSPDPTTYPVEFVFNNVSNVSHLATATAVATIDWEVDGGGESGQVIVPLSAQVTDPVYGTFITVKDFPVFNLTTHTNTQGENNQRVRYTGENTSSAGNTFTIPAGTTTTVSRVSVWSNGSKSFDTNSTHELKMWLGEYEDNTPGAAYAVELFDLAGESFAHTHLTFDLSSDVTLPPGVYAFQFGWTTTNAAHDLTFRRADNSTTFSDYDGGGRISSGTAELPFTATANANTDIRFAIHSRTDAEWVDTGATFPTGTDIVAGMDATSSSSTLIRNVSGTGNRISGQSFDLAEETTLSAITIQTATDESFDGSSKHELDLWIVGLDNGLSNNVPLWVDAVVLSGETMTSSNFYQIDFSDITLPAGSYGIEVEWAFENSNHLLNWRKSDGSVDEYADGYLLHKSGVGQKAPFDGSVSSEDLVFALHKLVETGFTTWIAGFGLSGDDLLEGTDVEPDGLDNLMEYALGGNPTNDDKSVVGPASYIADDGGTNYLYHVYDQRVDDAALTFTLGATDDLVTTPADTNDVSFVGQSAESGGFRTQTNRTEASSSAKFILLSVEK